MARIRTVKPEMWSDEDFIEMSHLARLLFVASLNFASDFGVLPDKPRTLMMQCLPGDSVSDPRALIEECVSARFYVRRVAPDGSNVLVIRTFANNQVIQRKTEGRWGNPDDWPRSEAMSPDESHPVHDPLNEDSMRTHTRKGREGKGREGNTATANSSSSKSPHTSRKSNRENEETVDKPIEPVIEDLAGRFAS